MPLPLLIAASAGASALKNTNHPVATPGMAGMQGGRQSMNFQQVMASMQQNGISVKDLMALSGANLQAKIKSLTPQQQQALVQQLYGAKLTVQSANGAPVSGMVDQVNLSGPTPTFSMVGGNYTLNSIQSIQAQA